MTHPTQLFVFLGGLLLLAFAANRVFQRTRIPDLVVLMSVGMLLGPVLRWINADQFRDLTSILGTLALILVLFEGGLELDLRHTLRHFPGGVLLALTGYALSTGFVTAVVRWSLKLSLGSSLLVGAVLGCTSSTMALPVLQQLRVHDRVKVPVLLEAALGDVIAVLAVGSLVDVAEGDPLLAGLMKEVILRILISLILALFAGVIWSRIWPLILKQRFANVATFGVVLIVFSASRAAGGSGLLAVLTFALGLANIPGERPPLESELQMLRFHSELGFLVRSFFFVTMGVVVEFVGKAYVLPIAGILLALLLARILAVQTLRWSSRDLQPSEREMIFWMFPRGLITAVLAIKVFEVRRDQFPFLPAVAFTVIMVTSLLVVFGSFRARHHMSSDSA